MIGRFYNIVTKIEKFIIINKTIFVKITGTFYDGSNNVVGTGFTYTNPSDIGSGQRLPLNYY
jgi:hypothetical protein